MLVEEGSALTAGRSALRRALTVLPQSRPDQMCDEERWRNPRDVCSRPTCGRCLRLKAVGYDDTAVGRDQPLSDQTSPTDEGPL